MKKFYLFIVAVMMVALAAGNASAVITGSAHDLSGLFGGQDQICVFCHAPHNAIAPTVGPLWNHDTNLTQTYTMYDGSAPGSDLQGTVGTEPSGSSKLCLSCHDSTIAIDSYGGATGTNFMSAWAPDADLGTDLSDDHPISITYTTITAGQDGELNDPSSFTLGSDLIVDLLEADELQCSTCHDVHNGPDVELNPKLLRETTVGSLICLRCHVK